MAEPSRWSRRYVATGALALAAWAVLVVAETAGLLAVPRQTTVALVLFGFVFHVVFGKGYALLPAYVDRELAVPLGPAVGYPLVAGGAAKLAVDGLVPLPEWAAAAGGIGWLLGVCVFVTAIGATVVPGVLAGETGTGAHNADREPTDRLATAFVPVVLAYLLVGSYVVAARGWAVLPAPGGPPALGSHLLAAGAASLLVFAVGARLLPRFFVARLPRPLVAFVLVAGSVGPALLALGIVGRVPLAPGAAVQTVAVVGYAGLIALLFHRTDRDRVGFYGVLAGAGFALVGVALGAWFAVDGVSAAGVDAHLRANLLGFLGLTIVGVSFQFYPPTVGVWPGSNDRTALGAILALAAGVGLSVLAPLAGLAALQASAAAAIALGVGSYCYLLGSAFRRATR